MVEQAPTLYQTVAGVRQAVAGSYVLASDGQVEFRVGAYNQAVPLVIDPVLGYSTCLGAATEGEAKGLAVDSAGDACFVGEAGSTDYPATPGAYNTTGGGIVVTKLNPAGTALIYSTYLDAATAGGIAVDASGASYITGYESSTVGGNT